MAITEKRPRETSQPGHQDAQQVRTGLGGASSQSTMAKIKTVKLPRGTSPPRHQDGLKVSTGQGGGGGQESNSISRSLV
jgi:hypothetical protein